MASLVFVNNRETVLPAADLTDAVEVEPGVFSVLMDGRSSQVRIATERDGFTVDVEGRRLKTEVRDPRNTSLRSRAALAGGLQTVSASMPGRVVRVLVEENQSVEAGQGLIVVEAMKMQNEMKASKAGRVVKVQTNDGDTVAAGDVLITIE